MFRLWKVAKHICFVYPTGFLHLAFCFRPAPKYKWERLDKTLSNETQVLKNYGRKLYFRSLKNSDGGTYRCIAENSQGIAIKEISLTVQSSSKFKGANPCQHVMKTQMLLFCQALQYF